MIAITSCTINSTSTMSVAPSVKSFGSLPSAPITMQNTPASTATPICSQENHSITQCPRLSGNSPAASPPHRESR